MNWREEVKLKQKAQEYYEKEFSYNQVYIQGYSDGYNKAINEFVTKAYRKLGCSEKELYCVDVIDEIAEQMKAGEIAE